MQIETRASADVILVPGVLYHIHKEEGLARSLYAVSSIIDRDIEGGGHITSIQLGRLGPRPAVRFEVVVPTNRIGSLMVNVADEDWRWGYAPRYSPVDLRIIRPADDPWPLEWIPNPS